MTEENIKKAAKIKKSQQKANVSTQSSTDLAYFEWQSRHF